MFFNKKVKDVQSLSVDKKINLELDKLCTYQLKLLSQLNNNDLPELTIVTFEEFTSYDSEMIDRKLNILKSNLDILKIKVMKKSEYYKLIDIMSLFTLMYNLISNILHFIEFYTENQFEIIHAESHFSKLKLIYKIVSFPNTILKDSELILKKLSNLSFEKVKYNAYIIEYSQVSSSILSLNYVKIHQLLFSESINSKLKKVSNLTISTSREDFINQLLKKLNEFENKKFELFNDYIPTKIYSILIFKNGGDEPGETPTESANDELFTKAA